MIKNIDDQYMKKKDYSGSDEECWSSTTTSNGEGLTFFFLIPARRASVRAREKFDWFLDIFPSSMIKYLFCIFVSF